MSMGSKRNGPATPKGVQLGTTRSRRPAGKRLSPRVAPVLRSNSHATVSGTPFESGATDTFAAGQLQGVVCPGGTRDQRAEYPPMDTNTNRRHGGSGTYYRQHEGWGY